MLLEFLISIAVNLFSSAITAAEWLSIPLDVIDTLNTIACYGSFVIGSDVLLIFCGSVTAWWSIKISLGLLKFIWELLPFT